VHIKGADMDLKKEAKDLVLGLEKRENINV
jgi:hypothetical protein